MVKTRNLLVQFFWSTKLQNVRNLLCTFLLFSPNWDTSLYPRKIIYKMTQKTPDFLNFGIQMFRAKQFLNFTALQFSVICRSVFYRGKFTDQFFPRKMVNGKNSMSSTYVENLTKEKLSLQKVPFLEI